MNNWDCPECGLECNPIKGTKCFCVEEHEYLGSFSFEKEIEEEEMKLRLSETAYGQLYGEKKKDKEETKINKSLGIIEEYLMSKGITSLHVYGFRAEFKTQDDKNIPSCLLYRRLDRLLSVYPVAGVYRLEYLFDHERQVHVIDFIRNPELGHRSQHPQRDLVSFVQKEVLNFSQRDD